jgi:hypothetical protein
MNILIISGSFYPINSPRSHRTTELAKELSRQGHDIKVIFSETGHDYSNWKTEYPTLSILPTKKICWSNWYSSLM